MSNGRVSTERSQPTCLVVEDDHTMRHLLMNYLGEHDIRAISASRRDEVAGLLVREEPNLVILDLRLGRRRNKASRDSIHLTTEIGALPASSEDDASRRSTIAER